MNRKWIAGGVIALAGMAAAAPAIRSAVEGEPGEPPIAADNGAANATAPVEDRQTQLRETPSARPSAPVGVGVATPMKDRIATIGLLNKRNGLWRELRLKPGQGVRIGDVIVKVRACDQTEPWEKDQLTGAFVQLIVHGADDKWRKVFSGWLYKETPSLNVVEHPVYDVWTRDCTMRHPDFGPDTVTMESSSPSKAAKSPDGDSGDSASSSSVR